MEVSRNLRLALEHKHKIETAKPPSIKASAPLSPQPRHLFNTMEEYTALKKARRFEPSWPLIHIQQAKERGLY